MVEVRRGVRMAAAAGTGGAGAVALAAIGADPSRQPWRTHQETPPSTAKAKSSRPSSRRRASVRTTSSGSPCGTSLGAARIATRGLACASTPRGPPTPRAATLDCSTASPRSHGTSGGGAGTVGLASTSGAAWASGTPSGSGPHGVSLAAGGNTAKGAPSLSLA